MILYLSIIGVCVLIISGIVAPIYNANFFYALGVAAFAAVLVIIVDALVATACRLLPKKWANHEKKIYMVSAKEKKFYEKLKIRKWKDYVPEIGHFTGFRKNKIVHPKSVEYLDRFLLEICYGEIGHTFSVPLGFLIVLLFPITKIWFAVAIPVGIVNVFMNLPSLFILRYNSYKLEVLRKSILKKQQRAKKSEALEEAATSEA